MSLLRAASSPLITALDGGAPLWMADLFDVVLQSNTYHWTTWETPLVYLSHTYQCAQPWIRRSKWSLTNTMTIPTMDVVIVADNSSFASGSSIKAQAVAGLFDGANFYLNRAYMTTPGSTSALGVISIFSGVVGKVNVTGTEIQLTVKGANNTLAQPAPRKTYLPTCSHTFCDAGCTLSAASFTTAQTVGSSPAPSRTFLPWPGGFTPPLAGVDSYIRGTITMTSGAANGQRRTIVAASSSGVTLAYPLYATPATGDGFNAFQGCIKTTGRTTSVGAGCSAYNNIANFGGFPFVPPPPYMAHGDY